MSLSSGAAVGGTAVGGTTVAIGAAAGVPHADITSEANNNTNSEPMCRRFTLAPFLGDECFVTEGL
jgi:hypothetical protein